jgi:PAS domain S-box-containing protein
MSINQPFALFDGEGRAAMTIRSFDASLADDPQISEEALHASHRFLQCTLDALPARIAILDESATIIAVNAAWRRFADANGSAGISYGVGTNYLQICDTAADGDVADMTAAGIREILAGQRDEFCLEYPCHSPAEPRWFILRATRFAGDRPVHVVVAHENITARKRDEAALVTAEAKYRTLVKYIPAIVYIAEFGADGTWGYVSPQIEPILGFSQNEWLADPQRWLKQLHPDDRERVLAEESRSRDPAEPFRSDYRLLASDGRVVWLRHEARVVQDDTGRPLFLQGFMFDITARKRADEERERLFQQVRAGRERLQALSHQLMEAQEAERRHIARELHDEIGQALTALQLNLQALQQFPDVSELPARLEDSMSMIERVLQQVRALSLDLHPSLLDDLGLVTALRWFLNRQMERAGFVVQFAADHLETRPLPNIEIACFRIAQEALTNVVRHARARHVSIELQARDRELHLLIHDDGVGFDAFAAREGAAHSASLGLLGMQERALLVGGQLEIESVPGHGTTLRARFPLVENQRSKERVDRRRTPR